MDWVYVMNNCLLNFTDEFTGLKAYNIFKNAAIVDAKDGKIIIAIKDFEVNKLKF